MAEGASTKVVGVDRGTRLRGLAGLVVGALVFRWGYGGGHGPVAMGPGLVQFLGIVVFLYGAAVLIASTWTGRRLRLSAAERARWLPALAPRREELLGRMAAGQRAAAIADALLAEAGVPPDVTLRYLIEICRGRGDQVSDGGLR